MIKHDIAWFWGYATGGVLAKKRNELLRLSETLRVNIMEVKDFEAELVKMASSRPTFDLDDGVANNYPKFYPLTEPIKGLDAKYD